MGLPRFPLARLRSLLHPQRPVLHLQSASTVPSATTRSRLTTVPPFAPTALPTVGAAGTYCTGPGSPRLAPSPSQLPLLLLPIFLLLLQQTSPPQPPVLNPGDRLFHVHFVDRRVVYSSRRACYQPLLLLPPLPRIHSTSVPSHSRLPQASSELPAATPADATSTAAVSVDNNCGRAVKLSHQSPPSTLPVEPRALTTSTPEATTSLPVATAAPSLPLAGNHPTSNLWEPLLPGSPLSTTKLPVPLLSTTLGSTTSPMAKFTFFGVRSVRPKTR
ncbi:hypothetical protein MRX96_054385 [Rhipicephalus microplus]